MATLYHLDGQKTYDTDPEQHAGLTTRPTAAMVIAAYEAGLYEAVATVPDDENTAALNYVYTATQNGLVSPSWSREPPERVEPISPAFHVLNGKHYGRRSTNIGDFVEINGRRYLVTFCGFQLI